ncbi:MAG: family 10 glycosylhydrolase, partial [Planctomycetota bacterium]|nr:family 10 glycosylhydrolase [Planctomycetota bacterium]
EPPRIAVFDTQAAGGQGASVDGLLRGLKAHGYKVDAIADLQSLTLLPYDIVYLSDMHRPGRVHAEHRRTLREYVMAGGSLLQTWHHHIFGEVSVGVRRVYGSRKMIVQAGHPSVDGVKDFDAVFKDHIVEKVGRLGRPILKNEHGDVVAAAGVLGNGKIISTGLALAIPNGGVSRSPKGAELALLKAFLKWLTPADTRDVRFARGLVAPRFEISPPGALTAAGYHAGFIARLGGKGLGKVRVECEGASIAPLAEKEETASWIQSFRVSIPTVAGESRKSGHSLRATAGEIRLVAKVLVDSVYGEPPPDEVRGVWLHVREDRHPEKVMPELKKLGINMAVLRIAGGTAAFYASKVQPDVQDPLAPDGDWLAETVRHAHANGIQIHPYVNNCIVEGRTSKASLERLRKAGRLQESYDGRPIDWFCPSQEANLDHMEKVMLELATRYKVDGLQYDFIRYPNDRGCFCSKCRKLFEEESGKAVRNWPADVREGPRAEEWTEFRCTRISAIVERISTRIRKAAPKVKISAAVFRDWPDCRKSVGQDWVRWCKEGWLDFICPMNYTLDAGLFEKRTLAHRKALPLDFPVVQGIGIASGRGRMARPEEVAVQIALARRSRSAGFIGFCYQPVHTSELFTPLLEWLRK